MKDIAAIYRGFSSENNAYRNKPYWELAIAELRTRIPELPMICDPQPYLWKYEN
ncbi:MAG: hypothetical protein R2847_09075 [Bacteroidia bacterium]